MEIFILLLECRLQIVNSVGDRNFLKIITCSEALSKAGAAFSALARSSTRSSSIV
jgi:hypothetical protein